MFQAKIYCFIVSRFDANHHSLPDSSSLLDLCLAAITGEYLNLHKL